jgi:hypothetical protein
VVSFGSVRPGDAVTRTIRIENFTDNVVDVSLPASPDGFPFSWSALNDELPHNAQRTIELRYRGTSRPFARGTLTVTSSAPGSPHRIQLLAKGSGGFPTDPGPELPTALRISPSVVTFGGVPAGQVARRTVTIENETGRLLRVSVPPPRIGPFSWTSFEGTIAHGTTRTITVEFRPLSSAIARGTMMITSDTPASPQTVGLTGKRSGGFPIPDE